MMQKVIDQVNKQSDPTIGLIKEGKIYFLVLNRSDNVFDFNYMKLISDYLDVVANAEGDRILVTIGTGPKIFSSGFDFKCWMAHPLNPFHTASLM